MSNLISFERRLDIGLIALSSLLNNPKSLRKKIDKALQAVAFRNIHHTANSGAIRGMKGDSHSLAYPEVQAFNEVKAFKVTTTTKTTVLFEARTLLLRPERQYLF